MSTKLSVLTVLAAVVLASCGRSGSSGPAGEGDAGAGATRQYGPAEFGLTDADLNARIEEAETLVAGCVTEAGFEYVPVDAATVRQAMDADGSRPGVSDEEFVAQFGFGITTVSGDPVAELGRGEQNTAIRASLAPSQQVAYDRALLGGTGGTSLARALEDEDFSATAGCTSVAVEDLFAPEELGGTYVNPGDAQLEQDGRMVDAIAAWSACLRDAGFDYEHPDDVTDELAERYAAVVGEVAPEALTGEAAAALAELQDDERAVAVVASTCEEEHIVPVEEQLETEIYGAPQS